MSDPQPSDLTAHASLWGLSPVPLIQVSVATGVMLDLNAAALEFFGNPPARGHSLWGRLRLLGFGPQVLEVLRASPPGAASVVDVDPYEGGRPGSWLISVGKAASEDALLYSLTDVTTLRIGQRRQTDLASFRQALLDRSSVGIFLTNPHRQIVELSETAARMFGYSRDELIGQSFVQLHIDEAHAARAVTYFSRLLEGAAVTMEYPYRHKDGSTVWCTVSGTPLDPEDRAKGTVWTLIDISERRRMEEEMTDSEDRYSAMVNRSPSIVLIHVEGRILFINEAGLRESGYEADEVLDQSLFKFLVPASQKKVIEALTERANGGADKQDYEVEFIRKDKELRTLVVKSAPIRYAGGPATLVILIDITERKRTEALLAYRESLEQQLTVLAAAIVKAQLGDLPAVLSSGIQNVAQHCKLDRAFVAKCDQSLSSFSLAHYWDRDQAPPVENFFSGITECSRWMQCLLSHSEVIIPNVGALADDWAGERKLLVSRGAKAAVAIPLVHASELLGFLLFEERKHTRDWHDDEIHFLRVVAALVASSMHRMTAEKELRESRGNLEAALVQANELAEQAQQASRSKSQFLANMSHELRTPLNVVLGMNEILRDGLYGELNADQMYSVRAIDESGRHLLSLINDILDLAKIEAGRLQLELADHSVRQLCEASLRMVEGQAEAKGLHLELQIPAQPLYVRADSIRLKQVLINLLSNAVKFTPEGGRVGLSAELDADPRYVHFCVTDSGIGISPEHVGALFQPFMQVDNSMVKSHGGTGLGLALVRHFVDMHKGTVQVRSRPGEGSRFSVHIPCALSTSRPTVVAGGASAMPPSKIQLPEGLRVLAAEDHPGNASVLSSMLRRRGAEVLMAENGAVAVEKAPEFLPDVILMDVQMPVMDGLEATRLLKADPRTAEIPLICLTAYAMAGDQERCLESGADGYVSKPIDFPQLFKIIAELVAARRSLDASDSADPEDR